MVPEFGRMKQFCAFGFREVKVVRHNDSGKGCGKNGRYCLGWGFVRFMSDMGITSAMQAESLAANVRPHHDGTLRRFFVELESEFQRVEQCVIEAEVVDALPALRRKAKMPVAVRRGRSQYRGLFLGAICHRHVWDRSARRIKNNILDWLRRSEFFNDNKFSNCLRRTDEECA